MMPLLAAPAQITVGILGCQEDLGEALHHQGKAPTILQGTQKTLGWHAGKALGTCPGQRDGWKCHTPRPS